MTVPGRLENTEEERLLMPFGSPVLSGIKVAEVMRALDQCHARISEVPTHGGDAVASGHMVGIKHKDELAREERQGTIDIARLRVRVVVPRDVSRTHLLAVFLHFLATTVVKHPHLVDTMHSQASHDGGLQHRERLVVRGNDDVSRHS